MQTRVYIDNFQCFVNFEYRPDPKQLIFGANGSGKSSFLSALLSIRQFAIGGRKAEAVFHLNGRTRWLDQPKQTFEIEAELENRKYVYRLVLDRWEDPPRPRVHSENVYCDGKSLFAFEAGEVSLYDDNFEQTVAYPFDSNRSAFETINQRKDNAILFRFKRWLDGLFCFRINPYAMNLRAEGEQLFPTVDLSNIAAWYRHLSQIEPRQVEGMRKSLCESMEAFEYLKFEKIGENVGLLVADFAHGQKTVTFGFTELSEGQRCLVSLYTILHFLIERGYTVILDEPENFVSLREIQPWLTAVSDAIDEGNGQVLLISHHPELIDQWAPGNGVRFVRDGVGPVRVESFHGDPESGLSPSELIARGWDQ